MQWADYVDCVGAMDGRPAFLLKWPIPDRLTTTAVKQVSRASGFYFKIQEDMWLN